jgi:hypothetical protein
MNDYEKKQYKKEYYRNYYKNNLDYFRQRNQSDTKKQYYRDYYKRNKELIKSKQKNKKIVVGTLVKSTVERIIVSFD